MLMLQTAVYALFVETARCHPQLVLDDMIAGSVDSADG